MRILITGSEGVLGSVLKTDLRFRGGHDVFGCDLAHTADSQMLRADISEYRQTKRVFDAFQPELVYHLAGEFGRLNGVEFYEQLWKANVIGTHNIIEECVRTNAAMIFASSSEAYGMANAYAANDPLTEDMLDRFAPQFHNEYALSKWTNERQITLAARTRGLRAIILRFFNVYGPPERYSRYRSVVCLFAHHLIHRLPVTVYRRTSRSHLWIGDWCNTIGSMPATCAFNQVAKVPVFNISGGDEISTAELYEKLSSIIQPQHPHVVFKDYEESNIDTKKADCSRAEMYLHHRVTMPIDEGLRRTVEWMLRNER